MKNRLCALALTLVLTVVFGAGMVRAEGQEQDWSWEVTEEGVYLTEYLGTETEIKVPAQIGGLRVFGLADGCFRGRAGLERVEIPHGICYIGEEVFYQCGDLNKVILSGSVNEIGKRAFAESGLITMEIPGSVHTVGEEAFLGCEELYNIAMEGGVEDAGDLFPTSVNEGSGTVKLREGVRTIGKRAFYGCIHLTRMTVPASVTELGEQALGYKEGDNGPALQSGYRITGYAGTQAEEYALRNGIEFRDLGPVDTGKGICGVEAEWSFDASAGILTITGEGRMYDYADAEYLPWYGFRGEVRSVIVEEGVESLGDYALCGSAVRSVSLPQSLQYVGNHAFGSCGGLALISFPGDAPTFEENAFSNTAIWAWYPGERDSWTQDVMRNFGGNVTWCPEGELPFVDVSEERFFYDAVAWAMEAGITKGKDPLHFFPDDPCTRGEVVTFLRRAMGCPAYSGDAVPYEDVPEGRFFYDAVGWAVENGITAGMGPGVFEPNANCTRAQCVTFLWRTAGEPETDVTQIPFDDVPANKWYSAPVAWAVKHGITNGVSATEFGVESICNRGQIVTFLYRLFAS